MAIEIERKYLVRSEHLPALPEGTQICQGYVQTLNRTTVRIRLRDDKAFLTLKGPTSGLSRTEFEYAIPAEDARQMLAQFCGPAFIEKIRYELEHAGMLWELDVFAGANAGLMIAEIELADEAQPFTLPSWAGEEVSGDPRYSNLALMLTPVSQWAKAAESDAAATP